MSVNKSVVERFFVQFFTNFQKIFAADWKCSQFDAYCLSSKLEVDIQYNVMQTLA